MNSKSSQHSRINVLPLALMLTLSLVLASGFFWMSSASKASANTPDINLARAAYPNIVNTRIDDCTLCHSSVPNLNPYGAAYKASGRGNASSFPAIENLDSDLDGATNIQEILALTFPGNPSDFPAVPTATKTNTPTSIPPTATKTNTPAATSVGPTATKTHTPTTVPPTATSAGPTATKAATLVGSTATKAPPSTGLTATRRATERSETKVTRTPGPRPTPVVQCVKDDDDYRRKSSDDGRRTNPCPPSYHPRGGGGGDDKRGGDDFFKQLIEKVNTLFQGKKKP